MGVRISVHTTCGSNNTDNSNEKTEDSKMDNLEDLNERTEENSSSSSSMDNLEDLVKERTEELAAEKLKADDLVYRMLPRAISEQLKNGQEVKAEIFECVTILFSDIANFTSLAAESTPMQVW